MPRPTVADVEAALDTLVSAITPDGEDFETVANAGALRGLVASLASALKNAYGPTFSTSFLADTHANLAALVADALTPDKGRPLEVGDVFSLVFTSDTLDGALFAASAKTLQSGDLFVITNTTLPAVEFIGTGALDAGKYAVGRGAS